MVSSFLQVARFTASSSFTRHRSTHIPLGSLLQHKNNVFLLFFFNSFTSGTSSESESDGKLRKGDTFTEYFLINSCGVSPTLARELSNRFKLKNPDGPNAVIALLKNYGFSETHIAKIVGKHHRFLFANAEKTLLPKLEFFRSIGVSNSDMPKIIVANDSLLTRSLENCLIPRYEILRSVVRNDSEVVRALKNSPIGYLYGGLVNDFVPNMELLKKSGVPQASISLLVTFALSAAYVEHSRFVEAVKTVKEIGFCPLKTNFVVAIIVLVNMRKTVWDSRFKVYEKWGWKREMALNAFKKFPSFMKISEETFNKKMSFLVKDMGWPSEAFAEYPQVISYSLEKRIIPRFSVIKVLRSKGLLEQYIHFSSIICTTEEKFLQKFVVNFQEVLPLLLDVYRGVTNPSNVM